MALEKVILHAEQISRRGETKYFQIPLHGTPIKIIAVEASAVLLSPPGSVDPLLAGQATGQFAQESGGLPDRCPNPGTASLLEISSTVENGAGVHTLQVGAAVNPTFEYSVQAYGHNVLVTADFGDTPETIAQKLAQAINDTQLSQWNLYGNNYQSYKPTASASSNLLTVTTDAQHYVLPEATGSCASAAYSTLFTIVQNEKAGVLSLQSPDKTDIFFACEAWGSDKNTRYGDYTAYHMMEGEWMQGKKRIATEVSITTASPILEAYYRDTWGMYYGRDISYGISVFVWYENGAK